MPPRPLRPKDEPGGTDESETTPELKINRRKAVSSACIPCRKRKSKCDGNVPACSTCTAVYRSECSYDADSDHRRKGALKRDIQSLQEQNDALDVIVASLRSLPEDEAISLLYNLRGDTSPDVIAAVLRNNVKLPPSFAPQTLEADFAQHLSQKSAIVTSNKVLPDLSRQSSTDDSQSTTDTSSTIETPTTWFSRPQDAEFVEHLLHHYFCWVHPFYQLFSRDHFIHDMGRGRAQFCSAMLVNALLSFACHYSARPLARTDPSNPMTAGDNFFAEAKRLLDLTDKPSLTTVQTLAIMSLRETSHGRDSNGYQYAGRCVRMALELGLHLSVLGSGLRSSELEVRKVTFWGVFNLETICSVCVGRLSQLPRAAADTQKPTIVDRTDVQTWRPYEDSNISASPNTEQHLRPLLFTEQLSKLSELASDMVNTFYAPQERFTSRRLATTYAQYQDWYQNLPDVFRSENTALPHVLVLHMYYYSCVLHLFRPYIKLDLQGANLYPRDTCTACANEISSLMNALRRFYGLRRVALPVTSLILSASTIHLLNLPTEPSTSHLTQALDDLQAMSTNHPFAAQCIDIIRSLAKKWNITLPEGAASVSTLRIAAQRSSPTSSNFWAPSIPRKVSSGDARSNDSSTSQHESPFPAPQTQRQTRSTYTTYFGDTSNQMDIGQVQNAFWTPFPGQTMPVPSQNVVPSMQMDISSIDSAGMQWDTFGHSSTVSISYPQVTAGISTPISMADNMDFESWPWR